MSEQNQDQSQQQLPQTFHVGDVVSLPVAKYNEHSGTIGTVAGQVHHDPFDQTPICLVHVLGDIGPAIMFAVSDLEPLTTPAAIQELTQQWGYRDITELIRRVYEQQLDEPFSFDYLCVLQQPNGEPFYCPSERLLWSELNDARAEGHGYEQCPAPEPEQQLWLVVGNFEEGEAEGEAQL
jgi:hypothetical protein